jgi:hypothetical protein
MGEQQLCRGMVLRDADPGGYEAGIVLGPAKHIEGAFTVVHGYLDRPPTCGLFEVRPQDVPRVWRRATPEEAVKVREWFLSHAEAWGPDSNGWVAKMIPADEQERR